MTQDNYNKKVDELKHFSDLYYKNDISAITDQEFDKLLKEIEEIEIENPSWVRADSPTQRVGSNLTGKQTLKHSRPMLSLENTYNEIEVNEWYNKLPDDVFGIVVEAKYDGVSFAARYRDGKLVLGLTRGDGEYGEDITENLKLIPDLNTNISPDFSGEVRGEIIMERSEFERLNKDGKYANPRNLASGTLKLLDQEEFKKRRLTAYVYWLEGNLESSQSSDLEKIAELGFRKPLYYLTFSYDQIVEALNSISKARKSGELNVDLDGAVLKVDNKNLWESIGGTSKFPHWAKAYKYDTETEITTVKDVEFWVGHSGKITPVAILEPVVLGGSTIQKATLNNKGYMEELGLMIGDEVNIKKAAEIIPFINFVLTERREGKNLTPVKFPSECPSCGSILEKYNDEHADFYCMNEDCKYRVIGKIVKYTNTMEIDGFAEIIVERLYNAGILKSIEDLYRLKDHRDELLKVDRMGEKTVTKLLSNIEASKSQTLEKFITAISIRNVGAGTSKRLLKKYSSLDEIRSATKEDLMGIEDIGEIVAQSLVSFFIEKSEFLDTMIGFGINTKQEKQAEIISTSAIRGKTFCITGALTRLRKDVEIAIEAQGGKVSSSVSRKTDYLVTNDGVTLTSKLKAAKNNGIPIINEEELYALLSLTS